MRGRRQHRKHNNPYYTKDQLTTLGKAAVQQAIENGKNVTLGSVLRSVCDTCGVQYQTEFGFSLFNIEFFSNLKKMETQLNSFFHAYVETNPISCLFEMESDLLKQYGVDSFSDFNMGPFLKQPLVCKYFSPPVDKDSIVHLTTFDVITHLQLYRRRIKYGRVEKEEFLNFLQTKVGAKSRYHLCVRVKSFGIVISMVVKTLRASREQMEADKQSLMKKCAEDVEEKLQTFKAKQMKKLEKEKLRKFSNTIKAAQLVQEKELEEFSCGFRVLKAITWNRNVKECIEIFNKLEPGIAGHYTYGCATATPENIDFKDFTNADWAFFCEHFCGINTNSTITNGLKKLAEKSEGSLNIASSLRCDEELSNIPELHRRNKGVSKTRKETNVRIDFVDVNPAQVHALVEHAFQNMDPVTLASLAALEKQVCKEFKAQHFFQLGMGTFTEFLERAEFPIALGNVACVRGELRADSDELFALLLHVRALCPTQADEKHLQEQCTRAIRQFYKVDDVEKIGHGTIEIILSKLNDYERCKFMRYHDAIFTENVEEEKVVGVLGEQSKDNALDSIVRAPCLVELQNFLCWDLVYAPNLGDLSKFLTSFWDGSAKFDFLKTSDGGIFKLDKSLNAKSFLSHGLNGNTNDCVSALVSVLSQTSQKLAPKDLLRRHLNSILSKLSDDCVALLVAFVEQIPTSAMRKFFWHSVVLPCLHQKGPTDELLRNVYFSSSQKQMLWNLGVSLRIEVWTKLYESLTLAEKKESSKPHDVENSDDTLLLGENDTLPEADEELMEHHVSLLLEKMDSQASRKSSSTCPAEVDKAFNVIEDIRQSQFGIGCAVFSAEAKRIIQNVNDRSARAIKKLADELYSKDVHFVLELIQNADDNSYLEGVDPSLRFTIQKDKVIVRNNEVGFTAGNIRALSDVAKSTKKSSDPGYIGQKGIGFKSVFRITNCPEVHSNAFHVKFDRNQSELGFVCPTWIDLEDSCAEGLLSPHQTNIVLPFKEEIKQRLDVLYQKFDDIHPSLLLFLHRLKCVIIENEITKKTNVIEMEQISTSVCVLRHNCKEEQWIRLKTRLDAKVARESVESTEISMAFPIAHVKSIEKLPNQKVFAFLPLRSYGFKFILNCDFLIPSSREDIDCDVSWNQWLRDEIAPSFIKALDTFKQVFDNGLEAWNAFSRFIPLEGEVTGFFHPVCTQIHDELRQTPCILSASGEWVTPHECVILQKNVPYLREVLTEEMLSKLGFTEIHPNVQLTSALASTLEIKHVGENQILDLLKNVAPTLEYTQETISWLRTCLLALNALLEDRKSKYIRNYLSKHKPLFEELKKCVILPMMSGKIRKSTDSEIVYFIDYDNKQCLETAKCATDFLKELDVVHPEFTKSKDERERKKLRDLLHHMGLKPLNAKGILKSHIIPLFKSEWDKKPYDVNIFHMYLKFMRDFGGVLGSLDISSLRDCIPVKIEGATQTLKRGVEGIYRGSNLGSNSHLETVARHLHVDFQFLSSEYAREKERWVVFFKHFLVPDVPLPVKSMRKEEEKKSDESPQKTSITIVDYKNDIFMELLNLCLELEDVTEKVGMVSELLRMLDTYWKEVFRVGMVSYDVIDGKKANSRHSSFAEELSKKKWISSPNTEELFAPYELWVKTEHAMQLLSKFVQYCNLDVNPEIYQCLGFKSAEQLTPGHLMGFLEQWSKDPEFETTFEHMSHVYEQFLPHIDRPEVTEFFLNNKVIYAPLPEKERLWYSPDETTWGDPTQFAHEFGFIILRTIKPYHDLAHLFFSLGVPKAPTPLKLSYLTNEICSRFDKPSEAQEKIKVLYRILNGMASRIDQPCIDLMRVPNLKDEWVQIRSLYLNDEPDIGRHFLQHSALNFIETYNVDLSRFLLVCGIESLSETVHREPSFFRVVPLAGFQLTAILNIILPFAQRYLHSKHAHELDLNEFEAMFQKNFVAYVALNLSVAYEIEGVVVRGGPTEALLSTFDSIKFTLWVSAQGLKSYASIFAELSRVFFGKKNHDLANFLYLVLVKYQSEGAGNVEKFVSSQGIDEMEEDVKIWKLPEESAVQNPYDSLKKIAEEHGDQEDLWAEKIKKFMPSGDRKPGENAPLPTAWPPPRPDIPGSGAPVLDTPPPQPDEIPELSKPDNVDLSSFRSPRQPFGSSPIDSVPNPFASSDMTIHPASNPQTILKGLQAGIAPIDKKARSAPPEFRSADACGPSSSERPSDLPEPVSGGLPHSAPLLFFDRELPDYCITEFRAPESVRTQFNIMQMLDTSTDDYLEQIGYFGEKMGFIALSESTNGEVKWLNEISERGYPYDLLLTSPTGAKTYVEVKTTISNEKEYFILSEAEWSFAQKQAENFCILRIYNIGDPDMVQMTLVRNPALLWKHKQITIMMHL